MTWIEFISAGDLRDRIPGARGLVLPKRLLDQRHKYRSLWRRQITTEDLAVLHRENARTVHFDRKADLLWGPTAQEGDDSFRFGTDPERPVGICRQKFA